MSTCLACMDGIHDECNYPQDFDCVCRCTRSKYVGEGGNIPKLKASPPARKSLQKDTSEIRTVSSTGAEKGVKLARFDLIPPNALWQIAEHFGRGARKYADRNWEAGYGWGKSYQALQRHLCDFWAGFDIDEETGSPHLAAAAFHVMVLLEYMDTHPEFDDRPRKQAQ